MDPQTTTSGTSSGSESKRDKFVRLANGRTVKVMKALRVLGNLGKNKRNYVFAQGDVDAIMCAIREELERTEQALDPPGHQLDVEFDLLRQLKDDGIVMKHTGINS